MGLLISGDLARRATPASPPGASSVRPSPPCKARLQGSSTRTPQLARNPFPGKVGTSRSLNHKLRDVAVAVRLEPADGEQLLLLEIDLDPAPMTPRVAPQPVAWNDAGHREVTVLLGGAPAAAAAALR